MVTTEQIQAVVRVAMLAPSVHHTQPWRFVATGDGFELHSDLGRRLEVLDGQGRRLQLSCGAALLHAKVAARAMGLDARVDLLPEGRGQHLATVHLAAGQPVRPQEAALAAVVERRHNYRESFADRPPDASLLDRLRMVAEAGGAWLRPVHTQDVLLKVQVLLSHTDQLEQDDPAYREEMSRWVCSEEREDGIAIEALPTDPERGSSLRLRDFALTCAGPADGKAPTAEHPDVLVEVSRDDTPASWLSAGMALDAVPLHAAAAGARVQPLGQFTDMPAYRQRLAAALSLVGSPQLVMRVGYVDVAAPSGTHRRELADVRDSTGPAGAGHG